MRFYVTESSDGSILGCSLTLRAAKGLALVYGVSLFRVDCITVEVCADSVRRLLGGLGGYTKDVRTVYEAK